MNEERFGKLEDSIDEIKTALIGNEKMGQSGIVQRLHDVEKKTAHHGRIITWVTMAWTVIVGGMLYFKAHIAESIVNRIN
jgi:hypothetical protein